jgi:hypothetical protein
MGIDSPVKGDFNLLLLLSSLEELGGQYDTTVSASIRGLC